MGRLHDLGMIYGTDKATFHGYLDFYEDHFPDPDEFTGRLLEIGIMDGNSIRMWSDYYPSAGIVGIDNHPGRANLKVQPRVWTVEGDATRPGDLRPLGTFDVIIDDGSHMTADQQTSFHWLYENQLADDGLYVIEDLHTSYIPSYVNSAKITTEWLADSGLQVDWFFRHQGDPTPFLLRHGLDIGRVGWTGLSRAESITAIIPGGQR